MNSNSLKIKNFDDYFIIKENNSNTFKVGDLIKIKDSKAWIRLYQDGLRFPYPEYKDMFFEITEINKNNIATIWLGGTNGNNENSVSKDSLHWMNVDLNQDNWVLLNNTNESHYGETDYILKIKNELTKLKKDSRDALVDIGKIDLVSETDLNNIQKTFPNSNVIEKDGHYLLKINETVSNEDTEKLNYLIENFGESFVLDNLFRFLDTKIFNDFYEYIINITK